MNNKKRNTFVSVALANSDLIHAGTKRIKELHTYLESEFEDFEILIIDNNLESPNFDDLLALLTTIPSIRIIEPSFSVDFQTAMTIALENSIGDYIVIINLMYEPIHVIGDVVNHTINENTDICIGIAKNAQHSLGYKCARPLISKLLKVVNYHTPKNSSTLRCLSRNSINSITKTKSRYQQLYAKMSQHQFKNSKFEFDLLEPKIVKKRLFPSISRTIQTVIFNSLKPLRWVTSLGVIGSFFALITTGYSFLSKLLRNDVADGWSSLVVIVSILFMILFIILSLMGEYLARLLNEQSQADIYWVKNERHSSVMVDELRVNVINDSKE